MLALLLMGLAQAGCSELEDGMASGPVVAGLLDGDLGRARRVCARDELGVDLGGLLTVDTPNFYGHVVGKLSLDGSVQVRDRLELFGELEGFRYDSVISAIPATSVGPGHTTLGASWLARDLGAGPGLALNAKLVLPTAVGLYQNSWPIGLDVGLAGAHGTGPWRAHWQLSALSSAALSHGPTQGRLGLAPTVGGSWRPGKAFEGVLDLVSSFGYTAGLDHLGAAAGLRFSDGKRWGMELSATLPLAGRERALAAIALRNTVRLGARH